MSGIVSDNVTVEKNRTKFGDYFNNKILNHFELTRICITQRVAKYFFLSCWKTFVFCTYSKCSTLNFPDMNQVS